MIVKDILPDCPVELIMVRTYCDDEDLLIGYCSWDCRELISSDGDFYATHEPILKYEWDGDMLVYWVESKWIRG